MEAGKLRHRVTIQKLTTSQNVTTGAVTESWSELVKVWAAVEPLSVREFIAASTTQSQISARIIIRYRDDILPNMRVVHGSRTYNIEGALPDKNSGLEYLTLAVSEVRNG